MAEKTKHTPGPWTVERGEGDGNVLIIASDEECICVLEHSEFTGLDAAKNGALIAAAPDLLAACQRTVDAFRFYIGDTPDFITVCQEAIAKGHSRGVTDGKEGD